MLSLLNQLQDKAGRNRLGFIRYSTMFAADAGQVFFGNLVPIELSYNPLDDTYTMKAYSPAFRLLEQGEAIPVYKAEIRRHPLNNDDALLGFTLAITFKETHATIPSPSQPRPDYR